MARPRHWAHTKNRAISSNGGSRKTRERWTLLPKKWHTSPALEAKGARSRVLTAKFESGLRLLSQIAVFLPHLYPPVTPRNVCVQPRPARFDIGSLATQGRRLAPQTMAFVIERAYREGMTDSGVLCACMIQKDADLRGRSQATEGTIIPGWTCKKTGARAASLASALRRANGRTRGRASRSGSWCACRASQTSRP